MTAKKDDGEEMGRGVITKMQAQALRLRADGLSFAAIGSRMGGISRRQVLRLLHRATTPVPKQSRYPALNNWMEEHGCNKKQLAEMAGISPWTLREYLRPNANLVPGKRVIDSLVRATGLTREEILCEEADEP